MATNALDRLSVEDELFVALDSRKRPMTIAMLVIFEDSGADFSQLLEHVSSRLHLVPRFRKKLMPVPFAQGRSVWVDDEDFDLRFHLHHVGLPHPGGHRELLEFASRVFSNPLDFDRPLWQMWIVDLADGRKALLQKTHHCLVDGISAVDIATVLFDATPEPPDTGPVPDWTPRPRPSRLTLLREGLTDNLTAPVRAAQRVAGLARNPRETVGRSVDTARSVESFLSASLPQTSRTSLDRQVNDPYRLLETVDGQLADARAAKKRCGATVNDVVLSATAAGLGKLLRSRGENTDGLIVRTVIPVSTRAEDQHYTFGNMIAAMVAELPVGVTDPWERLELVQKCTRKAKQTNQPLGVDFVARAGEFLPASLIAVAGRIAAKQPMYSLVVTNVPGPREPLYFVGGKLQDAYFFGPNLVERTDLAVAVLSYNGELNFGLTADRYRVPDIAVMAEGISEALAELSAK